MILKALLLSFLFVTFIQAKDYTKYSQTKTVMKTLEKRYGFSKSELNRLFSSVKVQKTALRVFIPKHKRKKRKDTRTQAQKDKAKMLYSKYGSWGRYARLVVNDKRVNDGIAYVKKYQNVFRKVEKKYGVPEEYIAAIIGIESAFGQNVGKYPVFDTLATLAFEKNRRNKFFTKELIKFMQLSKTEKFNPKNVYGSYAGAIGLVQFMPSNYNAFGVDFNGDGRITLQRAPDAIASVANYFKKNGWRTGEVVATRVKYDGTRFRQYKTGYKHTYHRRQLKGIAPRTTWDYTNKVRLIKLNKKKYDELWYGAKNFYVITRYNHSAYYAMAVHQLAEQIKKGLK